LICRELGIAESTLTDLLCLFTGRFFEGTVSREQLAAYFKREGDKLDKLLHLFTLPILGAPSFVPELENHLIVVMGGLQKGSALGQERNFSGDFYRRFAVDRGHRMKQAYNTALQGSQMCIKPESPAPLGSCTHSPAHS